MESKIKKPTFRDVLTEDQYAKLMEMQKPKLKAIKPNYIKQQVRKPKEEVLQPEVCGIDLSKDNFTLEEILSIKTDTIPFLLESFIPYDVLTVMGGESDVGKSLFYSNLGLAIIQGKKEFLGKKLKTDTKRVLIISTEDGATVLNSRFKKQLEGTRLDSQVLNSMQIILASSDIDKRIEQEVLKQRVDLVILDALGDVFHGDLNQSNQVRIYLDKLYALARKYRFALLFVHHIGKGKEKLSSSKTHFLGSVGIEGKVRSALTLSKNNSNNSIRELKVVKGNYVSEEVKNTTFKLLFDPVTLSYTRLDDAVSDQIDYATRNKPGRRKDPLVEATIIQLYEEGLTQQKIGEQVGRDKSTVCRVLRNYKTRKNSQKENTVNN